MNIGTQILTLRKQKNITQELLAAELGVTAAAVSKWEKGYTLPDILMLCALSDYFDVTTDELLGRTVQKKHAIVVAQTEELGQKISALAQQYHIQVCMILTDYDTALAEAKLQAENGNTIHYMFTAIDRPLQEREMHSISGVIHINFHVSDGNDSSVLNGIELYLKNMDAFKSITDVTANTRK